MWNRYCQIRQDEAATPQRQPGPSLRRGVDFWKARQAVRAGTRRRPEEMAWSEPAEPLDYDSPNIIYARVSTQGGRAYVGISAHGIWTREGARMAA